MVALDPYLPSTQTMNYDDSHEYPHRLFTLLPNHLNPTTLTPIGGMLELTNAVHIALNNNNPSTTGAHSKVTASYQINQPLLGPSLNEVQQPSLLTSFTV